MWMFGSRTTVKKVRNLFTWFSHGSGAILAPEPSLFSDSGNRLPLLNPLVAAMAPLVQ